MRTYKRALWPDSATDEEITAAVTAALQRRDRASLERIAASLDAIGGAEAALTVRGIAAGKPRLH